MTAPQSRLTTLDEQAQRLDTQRLQQEQNRQAIESAMEHMQTDLELQKLHSARQVRDASPSFA